MITYEIIENIIIDHKGIPNRENYYAVMFSPYIIIDHLYCDSDDTAAWISSESADHENFIKSIIKTFLEFDIRFALILLIDEKTNKWNDYFITNNSISNEINDASTPNDGSMAKFLSNTKNIDTFNLISELT